MLYMWHILSSISPYGRVQNRYLMYYIMMMELTIYAKHIQIVNFKYAQNIYY